MLSQIVFLIPQNQKCRSGVYCIENAITGKRYVGSAKNLLRRFYHHRSDLRLGKHSCRPLAKDVKVYGAKNFHFKVLEFCMVSVLVKREQVYLEAEETYNLAKNAGTLKGYTHPSNSKTRTIIGGDHHCAKVVYQFSMAGKFIGRHDSLVDAVRLLGKTKNAISHLSMVCKGKYYSAFGYRWSWSRRLVQRGRREGVTIGVRLTKNGKVRIFNNQREAVEFLKSKGHAATQSNLSKHCVKSKNLFGYLINKKH